MASKTGQFGQRGHESHSPHRYPVMFLDVFLSHFYKVLLRYIASSEELSKVFNLYVIQTKKTKAEVDELRHSYVNSLNEYSRTDREVGYLLSLLKKDDKGALDFTIKGKRKVLLFYGLGEGNLGQPLSDLTIKISEWINLLKSFSFFGTENLSKKIEHFKQFVLEENENYLKINGIEFLRAVYAFYLFCLDQEVMEAQTNRKATSQVTVQSAYHENNFAMPIQPMESRGLNIGKPAHRFRDKSPVVLPIKSGKDDQSGLTSTDGGPASTAEGIPREQQEAHVLPLRDPALPEQLRALRPAARAGDSHAPAADKHLWVQ